MVDEEKAYDSVSLLPSSPVSVNLHQRLKYSLLVVFEGSLFLQMDHEHGLDGDANDAYEET